ncbi:MAG TPA: sodium:solute symporter family protein [Clostridiales bacterium]|nr:sodium:solute symporter family protein [Clostridiales bacterium]
MAKEISIWATIVVYVGLMLGLGMVSSRKVKDISNFTVGKRNAGAWLSALSYGTAYFSAVMFVGYSGSSGWDFGLWSVLVGVGNAVFGALLAWLVLASRTRTVAHTFNIKSMPQLFYERYKSKRMLTFSAVIIFIFLLPYSASVYKGLTYVCSILLGIDEMVCMVIIAVVSALLLLIGGYLATLKADFVQGIIMMVGVVLLIYYVLKSPVVVDAGSISGLWNYMKDNGMQPMAVSKWVKLIATILMTSFGTWGLPQMIHKYYGIKDEHEIKRGTVISTFFALLVAGGGYFIGSFGRLYFSEIPEGGRDAIIPNMLNMSNLPSVLMGIILVLLISASVSTLSAITLTASSTVMMDLIKPAVKKQRSESFDTKVLKILCLVFVVLSFVVANTKTPILDMMSYSWGILSGSFMAPYLLALYWKGVNRAGAWAGMLSGFAVAFVPASSKLITIFLAEAPGQIINLAGQGPLFAVIAILVSLIMCTFFSLMFSKLPKNEEFYVQSGI